MSFLEAPGDLAEVPLAAVLIEVLNQRATGILTVEHGGGASRVFLREGVPVGAQSFTGFRPLGSLLLAEGLIDMSVLEHSLEEMARTGQQQGSVLVEMGAVTPEQVEKALSEQQAAYLTQIAGLSAGQFRFERADVPSWTVAIRISSLKAIVDALEQPQASGLVASAMQPVAGAALVLAPGYRQLAGAFGWSAGEEALVERLEGPLTLDAFLAVSSVPPERARAILAALLLLGLAAPRPSSESESEASEPVLGVVELADLAGVPVELVEPVEPKAAPAPSSSRGEEAASAPPARRSDPEEARRRRQRLLQRAMHNMGVGPLSRPPRPAAHPEAPPPRAQPGSSAVAGPHRVDPAPAAQRGPPPRGVVAPTQGAARAGATGAERKLRSALEAALPRARSADLFERLGLPRSATREQVKAAYFQLAKQLHPDRFAAPQLADLAPQVKDFFASVNEAYETLFDDKKRSAYLSRTSGAVAALAVDDESSASIDFQKAEACTRTRDFARGRGFYESALRADPRPEYQVAYAAALLLDPNGDRERAKGLAQAALKAQGCVDRAAFLSAILARDEGDEAGAERLLKLALRANPESVDAGRELRALEARRGAAKPSTGGLFRRR